MTVGSNVATLLSGLIDTVPAIEVPALFFKVYVDVVTVAGCAASAVTVGSNVATLLSGLIDTVPAIEVPALFFKVYVDVVTVAAVLLR